MAIGDEETGVYSSTLGSVDIHEAEFIAGADDGKRICGIRIHREEEDPFVWFLHPEVARKVMKCIKVFLRSQRQRQDEECEGG